MKAQFLREKSGTAVTTLKNIAGSEQIKALLLRSKNTRKGSRLSHVQSLKLRRSGWSRDQIRILRTHRDRSIPVRDSRFEIQGVAEVLVTFQVLISAEL